VDSRSHEQGVRLSGGNPGVGGILTLIGSKSTLTSMDDFVIHGCEQVLRFTQVERWDDLSEALKVQLGFNMGVVALGLKLSKADGFQALADAREGQLSMQAFRNHLRSLIASHEVEVDEAKIARPF